MKYNEIIPEKLSDKDCNLIKKHFVEHLRKDNEINLIIHLFPQLCS